ncbi:hypothetical protein [Sporosarcina limicola]|uniref:Uncharacterized protein n=1 Tax=Sporosarcina limicola TaxID=34101 RepID=A0A927R5P6_9BACL|nr:hypothetical protein [Sporosarcina limicola]MBE1556293.1 hypothetical protein [Sporosarcina limicola]
MSKRGRKPKEYPKEAIDAVIYDFIQENKSTGTLKYMDVFRHSKKMHELGSCEYLFSEDFWRKSGRQGREAIDQANKVYEYSSDNSQKTSRIKIVDTVDAVNKLFDGTSKNKEKLIGALIMNENKLKEIIKSNDDLQLKLEAQNEVTIELKQDINALKSRLEEYEVLFFQWLDASSDDNVPLVNLVRTGKTRSKVVDKLFETMFTEAPLQGYEEFERFRTKKKTSSSPKEKIIEFKPQNTLIDDLEL